MSKHLPEQFVADGQQRIHATDEYRQKVLTWLRMRHSISTATLSGRTFNKERASASRSKTALPDSRHVSHSLHLQHGGRFQQITMVSRTVAGFPYHHSLLPMSNVTA